MNKKRIIKLEKLFLLPTEENNEFFERKANKQKTLQYIENLQYTPKF